MASTIPALTGGLLLAVLQVWEVCMELTIAFDREDDGRWIAEVPELPGVLVYGVIREEAEDCATALAFRVLAEQIEGGAIHSRQAKTVCFA